MMNKSRRTEIEDIKSDLDDIRSRVEQVRDEEEKALSNMPYSLQDASPGQKMDEVIALFEEALCGLDETISILEQAAS